MQFAFWRRTAARTTGSIDIDDPLYRFARKLKTIDEAPAAMRVAMSAALAPGAAIRTLIFSPGFHGMSADKATLFAVLDDEWIVVSGLSAAGTRVDRAPFADTLSAELTSVLLFGQLKLDYASEGGTRSAVIVFNAVMERTYREALRMVLDGAEGAVGPAAIADERLDGLLKNAPFKFRCAARACRPPAQRVRAVRHWRAAMVGRFRWRQRERSPQAMLMLTDRELICVAERRARWWMQVIKATRYGYVATFCPLARLETWRIAANDEVATLALVLSTPCGGATVTAELPRDEERPVAALLEERLAA
ncbi:MAG: hypothetical protein ABSF67_22425 [Roseiarcus sp.]